MRRLIVRKTRAAAPRAVQCGRDHVGHAEPWRSARQRRTASALLLGVTAAGSLTLRNGAKLDSGFNMSSVGASALAGGRHFDRFAGWRGHTMDHNAAAGRQVSRWVHLAPNRSKASGSDQPGKPMLDGVGLPRGRLDRRNFGPFRRLFARQGSCTCNTPTPCPANGTTTIPLAHRLAGTWLGADRGRTLRRRDSRAGWCFPVRCGRHAVDPQFHLGEALLRPDQAALAALRPCRRQGDAAQQESRQGD